MKKLLAGLLFGVCASAQAVTYQAVRASTSNAITPTLQTGTMNLSSGTVQNLNVTSNLSLGTSTVTGSGLILNTSTLQSGATFFVSSGTVRGNLTVGTTGPYQINSVPLNIGDLNYPLAGTNLGQGLSVGRLLTGVNDMSGIVVTDAYLTSGNNLWAAFDARSIILGGPQVQRGIAFQGALVNYSTGSVNELIDFYGGSYTQGTGGVTNKFGYFYRDDVGTGTITSQYGIVVATLTRASNNYPIYINDVVHPSYLGNVIVTTITPTAIVGQANANVALAGNVGEIIISSIPFGSPVPMTSGGNVAVGTVTLTAGCWNVQGTFAAKATNAGTSFTLLTSFITTTILTAPSTNCVDNQCSNGEIYILDTRPATVPGLNGTIPLSPPEVTICITSPTTYYMAGAVTFTVSTASAFGGIYARRIFH